VEKLSEGRVTIGALILLALWLLVGLPWLNTPLERKEYREASRRPAEGPQSQPDGSSKSPYFVQVIPAPKSAQERKEEAEDREEKKASDWWLVRWTFALFAATIGLILATGVLGYFGWRQSRDMQDSIEAAQEANRINSEAAVHSRRAWLSVEDVKFIHPTEFREDGFVLRVSAAVKNFGSTPATGVWLDFTPFIAEAGEHYVDASARILAKARAHPSVVGATIFPQDTLVVREVSAIGGEHFTKSIKPRPDGSRFGSVILFVTASYQVLGDPTRRVTHHAHSYLNAPVGLKIAQESVINLPADLFSAGTID